MSNIQSYNALIDRFKAFASGHFILKRFSHGQIEVSDLEKFGEYPFMHVVPSNVTYAKGMKTFSFQIVLADMPRDKEDKTEYQREVLSDLQRIAEDLVAEITNHRVLFGDLITVNNVSLEPFLEEFQHTLTGWTISLDLLVPYYWDACSIPAEWNDFLESSTGGTGSILTFIDSITRDENGNVSLVNDEAEPSPNYYYGTNEEGVRGWYLLSDEVGLTCVTLPSCQTIIDIEAAIDLLQQDVIDLNADVALKANTADISAVGFSNDYNDLDNKPTIPNAQVNSDWNATSGVAEILNKPTIPTATSDLTNDGEDGVNPFITAQDLPSLTGYVPYTGATQNVDLGTHTLSAKDLVINHSSGSGVAASITKGGAGEALTVNKTSGSGNAMSVTGGVTQLSELHLTTDLADAYIASAATWNAKFNLPALTSGSVLFSNGTTIAQDNANLFWDDTNNRLGVGTNSPSASSIVDITSTTQGFLIPRMTTTQRNAITSPTTSLQIYNTTEGYVEYYDSFWGWMPITNQNEWKRKWGSEYFNDFGVNNAFSGDGVFQTFPLNGGAANLLSGAPSTTNFIGYQGLSTGILANGQSAIRTDLNFGRFWYLGNRLSFISRLWIPVLSDATNRYNVIFGISGGANSTVNTGCAFIYDEGGVGTGTTASANWQIITAASSVRTNFVTSVAVAVNTWYSFRIESNSTFTEIYYYINDVLVRTEITNIPTNNLAALPIVSITKTVGITSRAMAVDYLGYKMKFNSAR